MPKSNKQHSFGLNLELEKQHRADTDWVFGGASDDCITSILPDERELYLPPGELQNIGEEKMDCASRSPNNTLETKFRWLYKNDKLLPENKKWLEDNGYIGQNGFEVSDAFIAIKSGTTVAGNSLKAPLEAIRSCGLIPKSALPQLETLEAELDPNRITQAMTDLGAEFTARFTIKYEIVYEQQYVNLIQRDMLGVAAFAWPNPVNGEYPRTDNAPNHAFMMYKPLYYIFDNYEDDAGSFLKKLASDYSFLDYGYRVYIQSQQLPPKKDCWITRWWDMIMS